MGKAGQAESRLIGKDGSTEAGEAIEIDQPELGRAGEEDITEVGLDQAGADEISLAGKVAAEKSEASENSMSEKRASLENCAAAK